MHPEQEHSYFQNIWNEYERVTTDKDAVKYIPH